MKTYSLLLIRVLCVGLLMLMASMANAITYNLSAGQYPPCSTSWSVAGTTYTCTSNGRVTLANTDILIANTSITIVANNGFSLNNNTIGSAANRINLQSAWGSIESSGTNTINGNVTSTQTGGITLNGTTVTGSVSGGTIYLTGGSISGHVTSVNSSVTTMGTNLQGGASANNSLNITGGVVAGSFTAHNQEATFTGVTMTSGSIHGNNAVTITGGSSLGSSSASITVTANNGEIRVGDGSTVYGHLTAPSWSFVRVDVNIGSAVFGTCLPRSNPPNACTPASTLLGSWRMDEPYWNGIANEVIDSSGNNNHGRARIAAGSTPTASTALVTPAFTSGSQSTCSYGQFDSTSAPIRTFTYVELSGFPALPNSFTFTAWIRSTNASAQHQRILVRDDAQNGWGLSLADGTGEPRLRFFNRNIQNLGNVTGQGRNGNCGVFCLDTNPVIQNNTWYFIAATINTGAGTGVITLYVYSQTGTLLARVSSEYSGNWNDGTGTAAIGGETLASSEGMQSSFHFLGNIDEMEIYTGALSQSYIESLRTRVRTCPVISPHHYELQMPQSSIACMATPVTVVACADSSNPCTNAFLAAGGTTANLATSAGTLANTTITFSNAGVATTTLSHPTATNGAPVTVTLSNEQLAGLNARRCCQGLMCPVSNSCTTTFNSAGLAFATSSAPNVASIPHQIAGLTDNTTILRAVRTNTTTGACEARVTGTRNVQLAYECRNPISCVAGQSLTLAGGQASANNNNAAITYNTVSLNFNASGTAAIPLNYSDVGQVRLHARLPIAASAPEPAVTLTGTSSEFVVKPHSLVVTEVSGNPEATNGNPGFRAAGAPFSVQLEVRNANGQRTPNFGNEVISQRNGISVDIGSLVYPTGGSLGELTRTGPFTAAIPAGTLVHNNLRWSEVGSITLVPRLGGNDYLGAGDLAVLTPSRTIGRFYPEEFSLTASQVNDACSGFNYMGQPFTISYRIEARNQQGSVTSNYRAPGYANRARAEYVAENADDGVDRGTRLQVLPATDWVLGALNMNTNTAVFNRQENTQPDGPFENIQLGINLIEDGDSRVLSGRNMNPTTSGTCSGIACSAATLGLPRVLRFGRLRLDDAFGPETVNLPVHFATEFWNNGYWAASQTDSCTSIPRSAISYSFTGPISVDSNRTVPLGSGATQGGYGSLAPTNVQFSNGNAGHFFTAPTPGTGSFHETVNLTTMPWLCFDWDQNGNFNDFCDATNPASQARGYFGPRANIGFGQYRGHDRIIYWREDLQ